jgi:hypothetical protein
LFGYRDAHQPKVKKLFDEVRRELACLVHFGGDRPDSLIRKLMHRLPEQGFFVSDRG